MSGMFKKIGRLFQDVSDAYPSLANRISSQCTTIHSSTMKGFDPIVPYMLSSLELSLLLKREHYFSLNLGRKVNNAMSKMNLNMDNTLIMFMLVFPSCLGGFPIMCPLELIYRGHPDPVTSELFWLKWLCQQGSSIAKLIMMWVTKRKGICPTRNYKMLVQDPLALN